MDKDINFSFLFDDVSGVVDIFINNNDVASWCCEDDPEACLCEFIRVFELGRNFVKPVTVTGE